MQQWSVIKEDSSKIEPKLCVAFYLKENECKIIKSKTLMTREIYAISHHLSSIIITIIFPSVCLCPLTLYPATDCAAAADISGVSGRWQLSR